ncbi:MAG TPA: response regulator transcription factor [Gaiellaceae bacterium]|jgi:DNA-binding response OmpR family regulator
MSTATALLVADTEPATHRFLARQLPQDGFRLVGARDCPDLVLAGDVAGVERWADRAPVIVLGGVESAAVDRIRAFRRGCDDYLALPFEYEELVERIHAVLRRVNPPAPPVVDAPPVRVDTRTRDTRVAGTKVTLSQKEYDLLVRLAREPDRVFTKAELLRDVWGFRVAGRTRTLDSHASRLRRKLRDAGGAELVDNVWGVGYRLHGTVADG